MAGRVLKGRYRLLEELGVGGMGIVYRAHDLLLDRQVAVKVLSEISQARLGSEGRSRLLHEAVAAARLNHPNIVHVHDAGEDDHSSFIVMEYVEGWSLYSKKPASIQEIISIARQICAALEHAHTNGIIHRDLKPENVLISVDGTAKLTDFGLARSSTVRITMDGMIVGTVLYLAPESALRREYDGRVDLYSLGVMLYELTTGRLPFSSEDPLATISQHLYAPLVPPRGINPEIPPALEDLIVRLMSKRPEDRPKSAGEVLHSLDVLKELTKPGSQKSNLYREVRQLDRLVRGRMVGREKELDEILAAWRSTVDGEGQVLLISGEPGIGKSRLCRELVTQAYVSNGIVLTGSCYPEGGMPYAPFNGFIEETLDGSQSGPELPIFALSNLAKISPVLRERYANIPVQPVSELHSEQQMILESVAIWCSRIASRAPVLLFIDDIHWGDDSMLSLLRHLARRASNLRLLVLLTYREIELEEGSYLQKLLLDLNREKLATRLKLVRFNENQTKEMIATMLTPIGEIADDLVEVIHRETEGNPFFVEEVCKTLVEAEKIHFQDGKWLSRQLEEIEIPQSVRVALQTRLARLPSKSLDVLRTAAILGREFDFDTLKRACEIPEDDLIAALESAQSAQIILEQPSRSASIQFAFAHGLIPVTLRESLTGLRRQILHRNVAQTLERLVPNNFESLAYHFKQAGIYDRARNYYLKAGRRALKLYANQEAEHDFRAALAMEDGSSDRPTIIFGLGEALFRQSSYEQAAQTWEQAIEGFQQLNNYDDLALLYARLARAYWYFGKPKRGYAVCQQALKEIPQLMQMETPGAVTLLHETARAYRFNNQPAESLPLCRQALSLAERLGLVEVQAETLATIGILPNVAIDEAHKALEKAVELSEAAGLYVTAVRAHTNLGEFLHRQGDLAGAREHHKRGRELARTVGITAWEHGQIAAMTDILFETGDIAAIEDALDNLIDLSSHLPDQAYSNLLNNYTQARLLRFKGEWDGAIRLLEQCIQEARERELHWLIVEISVVLADLHLELEQHHKVASIVEAALPHVQVDDPHNHALALVLLSAVRANQQRFAEARQLMENARQLFTLKPHFSSKAILDLCIARIAAAESDWDLALKEFAGVIQLLEDFSLPWYQGRIMQEWAQIYLSRNQSGDRHRAIDIFCRAQIIYQSLGLPLYARHIELKLAELN